MSKLAELFSECQHNQKCAQPCRPVFRYRESHYLSGNKIVTKCEWIYLKRLSCRGECSHKECYSPLDDARDAGADEVQICMDEGRHPKDGQLYVAVFCPTWTDFETGYVEEWYWKMVPTTKEELMQEQKRCPYCGEVRIVSTSATTGCCDDERQRAKRDGDWSHYPHLQRAFSYIASDNGMGLREDWEERLALAGENLGAHEEELNPVSQEDLEVFCMGSEEEQQAIVDHHRLHFTHQMLSRCFDGDLHDSVFI